MAEPVSPVCNGVENWMGASVQAWNVVRAWLLGPYLTGLPYTCSCCGVSLASTVPAGPLTHLLCDPSEPTPSDLPVSRIKFCASSSVSQPPQVSVCLGAPDLWPLSSVGRVISSPSIHILPIGCSGSLRSARPHAPGTSVTRSPGLFSVSLSVTGPQTASSGLSYSSLKC